MMRLTLCSVFLFGLGSMARAGELDKELATQPTNPAIVASAPVKGSELDKESPVAAFHGHGGWGYGFHHGYYGGFYRPYYYGGFYRPYYYGGFYRPYYYGFYRPYYYGGFYPYSYTSFYYGGIGLGCWW